MTAYQLWAHQMFPRTNLHDTLVTVEKLCHKRTMHVRCRLFYGLLDVCADAPFHVHQRALKGYRDIAKYGPGGKPPAPDYRSESEDDRRRKSPAAQQVGSQSPVLQRAPVKLELEPEFEEDDGFGDLFGGQGGSEDEAAYLAAEEEMMSTLAAATQAKAAQQATQATQSARHPMELELNEEEEAMMREMGDFE